MKLKLLVAMVAVGVEWNANHLVIVHQIRDVLSLTTVQKWVAVKE